ncbi:fimbrial protein [Escherichia marmotae]|uniref:Fimbrial protein n=1 Tax=Escherichia marmotae TaxID=1499973 RepID=A0A7H9KE60_9ESCH|nr:fimbrial protein [Escherichia marmotae]MEC9629130.1 fimbrial protein [Escherichia marmotae]MED0365457.1 fimbrial protein [Escherichia marmotae]MED8777572.1 fimbrial protein [Escherichia marmotae]MED9201615.1 fimbrial protein [Escherichia marmotae]QLV04144.1 fimbrial protein [Escherichia marmotae]
MKKTLIALAVAVSAVSGAAHAWTTGDFNGSFDMNGTITADTYKDKWEWMVGDALSFENTTKEMTDGSKLLTITQSEPAPILLGRTKEAFAAPMVGVGAIPLIAFSDYEGNAVALQSSGDNGKGFFELPMKDDSGNNLGSVKVNVTSAGVFSHSEISTGYVGVGSVTSDDNTSIYYGGLVSPAIKAGKDASSAVAKFGNYNHTQLLGLIKAVIPDAGNKGQVSKGSALSQNMVMTTGDVIASSYALGIDQGQTIEATFTNPVVSTTQWSAPLNVAVTYN